MLISLLIFLLLSNAVTSRQDKSILFSRVVIGAGYYLNLVKQIFFFKEDYKINPALDNLKLVGHIIPNSSFFFNGNHHKNQNNLVTFKPENVTINSSLSTSISVLTLLLVLFIYIPGEWFNIVSILSVILFKG